MVDPRKLNCNALIRSIYVCGLNMLGFASVNLAIRTMVVWHMKWYAVVPLCILSIGYWAVSLQNLFFFGTLFVSGYGCIPVRSSKQVLIATFIYPVGVDFTVLCLTAWKLIIQSRTYHRSRLMKLLFQDGFIYFIIVFLVNVPTAVICYLQLDPIKFILFGLPAALTTVIASSRAVRRLSNFSAEKPAVYMTNTRGVVSEVRFTRGPHTGTSDPVSSPLFSISHNPSDRSSVPKAELPMAGNQNSSYILDIHA
ncbi:hypothetical protein NLI96_g3607 [Meripilus lineatus]|uniref:MSP domain-containing protein n=1 Tax=Meripilus lineatus TaxID=2056292 RepID=A0AAD5V8K2_9APHY|nr:hypothetical protein NLI96_g3607 [Physisporinus lineatus]